MATQQPGWEWPSQSHVHSAGCQRARQRQQVGELGGHHHAPIHGLDDGWRKPRRSCRKQRSPRISSRKTSRTISLKRRGQRTPTGTQPTPRATDPDRITRHHYLVQYAYYYYCTLTLRGNRNPTTRPTPAIHIYKILFHGKFTVLQDTRSRSAGVPPARACRSGHISGGCAAGLQQGRAERAAAHEDSQHHPRAVPSPAEIGDVLPCFPPHGTR